MLAADRKVNENRTDEAELGKRKASSGESEVDNVDSLLSKLAVKLTNLVHSELFQNSHSSADIVSHIEKVKQIDVSKE